MQLWPWYFGSRVAVCEVPAAAGPVKQAIVEARLSPSAQQCSILCSCWLSLTLPFNLHIQKAVGPTGLCQEVNIKQSLSPFSELQGPQKKGSPSSLQVRFFSGIYIPLLGSKQLWKSVYHPPVPGWCTGRWSLPIWALACLLMNCRQMRNGPHLHFPTPRRKKTHPQNPILLSWQMVLNSSVPLCLQLLDTLGQCKLKRSFPARRRKGRKLEVVWRRQREWEGGDRVDKWILKIILKAASRRI